MRVAYVLITVGLVAAVSGCPTDDPPPPECGPDMACPGDMMCVDGMCQPECVAGDPDMACPSDMMCVDGMCQRVCGAGDECGWTGGGCEPESMCDLSTCSCTRPCGAGDECGWTGGSCDTGVTCDLRTCTCGASEDCGNGRVDVSEDCDGTELNGMTCASVVGADSTGTLGCTAMCMYDTSGCSTRCGNGEVDPGEACDGDNLNEESCESLEMGFTGGTLACASSCTEFDTAGCTGGGENPTTYEGPVDFCGSTIVDGDPTTQENGCEDGEGFDVVRESDATISSGTVVGDIVVEFKGDTALTSLSIGTTDFSGIRIFMSPTGMNMRDEVEARGSAEWPLTLGVTALTWTLDNDAGMMTVVAEDGLGGELGRIESAVAAPMGDILRWLHIDSAGCRFCQAVD